MELCGGTHVERTGDIGQFKIVAESGVSAGVRRIEAVAGKAAENLAVANEQRLSQMAAMMKVGVNEAPERLASLLEERRAMERQIAHLQRQLATGSVAAAGVEQVGAFRLATRNVGETPARELKGLAETILKQGEADVVVLISTAEGKGSVVAAVAPAQAEKADAVALVRAASVAMGGKGGGGRRDMAQAGGPDGQAADAAFAAVREALKELA
jgi:alanyl-tRNA synthetase